jgi:hypothetical protein
MTTEQPPPGTTAPGPGSPPTPSTPPTHDAPPAGRRRSGNSASDSADAASGDTAPGFDASDGAASGGAASGGTASDGAASGGAASGGAASGGAASGGTASGGVALGAGAAERGAKKSRRWWRRRAETATEGPAAAEAATTEVTAVDPTTELPAVTSTREMPAATPTAELPAVTQASENDSVTQASENDAVKPTSGIPAIGDLAIGESSGAGRGRGLRSAVPPQRTGSHDDASAAPFTAGDKTPDPGDVTTAGSAPGKAVSAESRASSPDSPAGSAGNDTERPASDQQVGTGKGGTERQAGDKPVGSGGGDGDETVGEGSGKAARRGLFGRKRRRRRELSETLVDGQAVVDADGSPGKDALAPGKDALAPGEGAPASSERAHGTSGAPGRGALRRGAPSRDEPNKGAAGAGRKWAALPEERPPGAPQDPWSAFAQTAERAPGRVRRAARAVGRVLRHEYALVIYGSVLLAAVLTWPTLKYPLHTLPQDLFDPSRQAWQVAWAGHILVTDPARLWQGNAFYPENYSYAFGDSLLGYAPLGMLGSGPLSAILRYNILFVLAHALLSVGGYALLRQLGSGRTGAVLGAVAFAYAPWRLAQEGHLDVVSAGGIPLALAMLARGHGWSLRRGFRPERRHLGWAIGGWAVVAWQITLGFSLGLPFAYAIALLLFAVAVLGLVRLIRRRPPRFGKRRVPLVAFRRGLPRFGLGRRRLPGIVFGRRPGPVPVIGWRLGVTDLLGALIVAGIGALIAVPYYRVADTAPAGTQIDFFSPPLQSFLIGPAESRIWGASHAVARDALGWPAEMSLLPGFVLYALALVGLLFSVWKLWQRLVLLGGVLVTGVFALGTSFFGGRWTYLPLYGHFPSSFDVRVPGRLMLWATLLLAVLAAGAVAEFVRRAEQFTASRIPPWPGPWLRTATFIPVLLVLIEGWGLTAHPVVPAQPTAMRTVSGPLLVLPTAELSDQIIMLWSTSRFEQLANGGSGPSPQRQSELRAATAAFPDPASIQYLRGQGIRSVVLLRAEATGSSWERAGDLPVDTFGISREDLDDNTVLFRLG